jgi:Ras-related protein Rab-1A
MTEQEQRATPKAFDLAAGVEPEGFMFEQLPDEVLLGVLAHLKPRIVGRAAQVCRRWRGAASDERLWAYLWQRDTRHRDKGSRRDQSLADLTADPMAVGRLKFAPPPPAAGASWRGLLLARQARLGSRFDDELPTPPPDHHLFKLLLTGPGRRGAGKTSFMFRFAEQTFSDSWSTTIGIDFKMKMVGLNGQLIKLQLWETAGARSTGALPGVTASHYRGATGIFIMFDVSDRHYFERLNHYIEPAMQYAPDVPKLLVGCKGDLRRREHLSMADFVSYAEAEELARVHGLQYMECSAHDDDGVEEAVHSLVSAAAQDAAIKASILDAGKGADTRVADDSKKIMNCVVQ